MGSSRYPGKTSAALCDARLALGLSDHGGGRGGSAREDKKLRVCPLNSTENGALVYQAAEKPDKPRRHEDTKPDQGNGNTWFRTLVPLRVFVASMGFSAILREGGFYGGSRARLSRRFDLMETWRRPGFHNSDLHHRVLAAGPCSLSIQAAVATSGICFV